MNVNQMVALLNFLKFYFSTIALFASGFLYRQNRTEQAMNLF